MLGQNFLSMFRIIGWLWSWSCCHVVMLLLSFKKLRLYPFPAVQPIIIFVQESKTDCGLVEAETDLVDPVGPPGNLIFSFLPSFHPMRSRRASLSRTISDESSHLGHKKGSLETNLL